MWLQYNKVGKWRDYLFGEKAYIILSLTAKALLAWQVFSAVLASSSPLTVCSRAGPARASARRRPHRVRYLRACPPSAQDSCSTAGSPTPRPASAGLEVLLVHPGGPYWAKKDAGAWSIPKGLAEPDELGPEPATVTAAKARNRAAERRPAGRRAARGQARRRGWSPKGPSSPSAASRRTGTS